MTVCWKAVMELLAVDCFNIALRLASSYSVVGIAGTGAAAGGGVTIAGVTGDGAP
jgi:hypothetical protein